MKRMLINATQEEELRMAMVDGQLLYDLNIEAPASERKKANIYKGKITRVEPSLEAAFVDYGADRHGFLPLKEISSEYFVKEAKGGGKPNIKDVLREGQDIVVQVDKEERGNKGAALTTFVSLAGRFIVLKPNKDRSGGVSRRITGEDRDLARQALKDIDIPDSMSVILRTAGIDRSSEELKWDIENLLTVWTAILNVVLERPSPFLIYRESDSVVRALRDYLTNDIGEILIDNEQTYKDAYEHVEQTMPHNLKKLKHYVDPVPLFTRFQIESQIESAFAHNVTLPSGGSIVIDHTEAMVAIDINSARATKGGDIEATAFNTNLEAADEIARQLRIRDLGGLVVIDFIDMGPQKHQREVENRLREAVRKDRARVQIGKISRFGLLEMSRQRLRPSIGDSAYKTCPRCTGFGTIRGTESLALAILRIVGEEARKERTAKVIAQLPVEVATYLLNEKRDWVQNLEDRNDTQVVLVANPALETPHYDVRRVRDDQTELPENAGVSFSLAETQTVAESPQAILERKGVETAAVGTLKPSTPAPKRAKPKSGLWAAIVGFFTAGDKKKKKKKKKSTQQRRRSTSQSSRKRRPKQQARSRSDSRNSGDKQVAQRKKTKKKAPAKRQNAKKDAKPDTKSAQSGKTQKSKPTQTEKADETGTEQKRNRNRRSRGGRRRRRSGERTDAVSDGAENTPEKTAQTGTPKSVEAGPEKPQRSRTKPDASATELPRKESVAAPANQHPAHDDANRTTRSPQESGPPKARTDDERQSDPTVTASPSPRSSTPPEITPPPPAEKVEKVSEPKVAPPSAAISATGPADNKVGAADAKPAKKSPHQPAESTADSAPAKPAAKTGGRLLPWDPPGNESSPDS